MPAKDLRERAKQGGRLALAGGMLAGWAAIVRPTPVSDALNGFSRLMSGLNSVTRNVIPEPLQTLGLQALCKAQSGTDRLADFVGATDYRGVLPDVCTSDLGARLAVESTKFGAYTLVGLSTTVLAVGVLRYRNSRSQRQLDMHLPRRAVGSPAKQGIVGKQVIGRSRTRAKNSTNVGK